jgi:hypothetical protein
MIPIKAKSEFHVLVCLFDTTCHDHFFNHAKFQSHVRRTVVSIPNGPSALAVKEAAWGLARYAAISQVREEPLELYK